MASPYYENPELYGLRRSSRPRIETYDESDGSTPDRHGRESRYVEYSSESESDSVQRRRKPKAKSLRKKRIEEEVYESNNEEEEADEGVSASETDDEDYGGSSKRARKLSKMANSKKRLKVKAQHTDDDSGGFGTYTPPTRFSSRGSKVVNYTLDDNDDADLLESDEDAVQSYVYVPVEQAGKPTRNTKNHANIF